MKTIEAPDRAAYKHLDTPALRQGFVLENLFAPGQANLAYTNVDRAVVGGIVPTAAPLALAGGREMACEHFHDRRESGIINLGAPGVVTVDGTAYPMSQIPADKYRLASFVWLDYMRPLNKEDIFNWRGKKAGQGLKQSTRRPTISPRDMHIGRTKK